MTLVELVRALSPNRPLEADDARYVERPENGGERLARIAAVDPDPIAVFGPPGVGKSTELARAAQALTDEMLPVLVRLDRRLDLSRVTNDDILRVFDLSLVGAVSDLAGGGDRLAHSRDEGLHSTLENWPKKGLLNAIRHAESTSERRIIFLVDGLDRVGETVGREIVKMVGSLSSEAGWIFVTAHPLVMRLEALRQFSIEPLSVESQSSFLRALLDRYAVPGRLVSDDAIECAVRWSGGIPRIFLSLLKSAAIHARLADRGDVIDKDMKKAVVEHKEAMNQILVADDYRPLFTVAAGQGIDRIPPDSRERFLSHCVLIQRTTPKGVDYAIHPFIAYELDGSFSSLLTSAVLRRR